MSTIVPRIFILIFLIGSIIIFSYFYFLFEDKTIRKQKLIQNQKIVAYSLLKEIEIDSEEYNCDGKFRKVGNEINHGNQNWTKIEKTNIFVYSFYRDKRLYPYEYLRIVAMIKGDWKNKLYCQIQSSNGESYITKTRVVKIWSQFWNQNDRHSYYNPFLLSCHLPSQINLTSFSLSHNPCMKNSQSFQMKTKDFLKSHNFTICIKPLNFYKDISQKLLQWIVMNRILGASNFEFYIENLSSKTIHLLKSLKQLNYSINLKQFRKIEDFFPDKTRQIWQKRRYEILTYNDCFYRNIHTSQFVIPLDIDEIIIPRHVSTWAELLNNLIKKRDNYTSYTVRNTYYLRQFNPKNNKSPVFFFENVVRTDFSSQNESGKSFISTSNALTVFNHYALHALRPGIGKVTFLKTDLVQMNHYKNDCDTVILPECAKYKSSPLRIVDDIIFKYKRVFNSEYTKIVDLLRKKKILHKKRRK